MRQTSHAAKRGGELLALEKRSGLTDDPDRKTEIAGAMGKVREELARLKSKPAK